MAFARKFREMELSSNNFVFASQWLLEERAPFMPVTEICHAY